MIKIPARVSFMRVPMSSKSLSWGVLVVVCATACGGGGSSDGSSDESSSSTGDEPTTTTLSGGNTSAPTSTSATTLDTSGTESGESGTDTDTEPMPPMQVGPCEEDPATPAGQTGTPGTLRTWEPQSSIDVVTVGPEGNRYIAGTFTTSITFGEQTFTAIADVGEEKTAYDSFVAALDPAGELLWLHQLHGDGFGVLSRALVLDGNGFLHLGGEFSSSLWIDDMERANSPTTGLQGMVATFTGETGDIRWVRTLTGPENEAGIFQLAVTPDNKTIAAIEWQNGTWTLGDSEPIQTVGGIVYVQLDGYGQPEWWRQGTWSGIQYLGSSAVHALDGGGMLGVFYTDAIPGETAAIAIGPETLTNSGPTTSYFVQLDDEGDVVKAEAFQSNGSLYAADAALTSCGDLVVVGGWGGEVDLGGGPLGESGAFVWRRDPDGNHRWSVGLPGVDGIERVIVDGDGQATIAGSADNIGFVARYSATGEELWNLVVDNGAFYGYPSSLALDPDGNTVIGSLFFGLTVDGLEPIPFAETTSAMLLDLAP